jgi:hypothetical protein
MDKVTCTILQTYTGMSSYIYFTYVHLYLQNASEIYSASLGVHKKKKEKYVKTWFLGRFLLWPARSPDLNPLDLYLWCGKASDVEELQHGHEWIRNMRGIFCVRATVLDENHEVCVVSRTTVTASNLQRWNQPFVNKHFPLERFTFYF